MAKSRRQPTLREVAELAGVSVATASRAMSDYGRISDETRTHIRQVAHDIGYRPNKIARSMITGRSDSIGVVCADLSSPFFAEALRGITDRMKQHGFSVLIMNTDEDLGAEQDAIEILQEKLVDGVIVSPANVQQVEHLAELQKSGRPVVLIDRSSDALQADSVTVDDVAAMSHATAVLLRAGHRRIGIVTELRTEFEADWRSLLEGDRPRGELNPSSRRLMGYLRALREHDVPVEPALVARTGSTDAESARKATHRLLEQEHPTAIITVDNATSTGAFSAIRERGIRVPDDLSFIAFDNLDWTTLVSPPLSVIEQPVYEIGQRAAQLLIHRLQNDARSEAEEVLLDTRFIPRSSVREL